MADGRLHLSAVVAIAPHLRRENAEARIVAATHRSMAQGARTGEWLCGRQRFDARGWGEPVTVAIGSSTLANSANVTELSPKLDSNPVGPDIIFGYPISGTATTPTPPTRRAVTHRDDDEARAALEELLITLEQRMRAVLQWLGRGNARRLTTSDG